DRTDFRDETIYFAMTTRFYDGDPQNNTYCWDGDKNINDPEWRGDFKGLIQKLDYIKALGFTAVWITPIVENGSGLDYHGYHALDFSKVDHRYVSKSASAADADVAFQELINEVHARGMKLILDIVIQHTGNFGEENLCRMFRKDYSQDLGDINASMIPQTISMGGALPDNYNSLRPADQYGTRLAMMKNTDFTNKDTHNYWHHKAWFDWDDPSRWWGQIAGDCVDLNTENPAVTNYLVDCYSRFIKMGVDGFRIDTAGHIPRLSFNKMFIPQFIAASETKEAKENRGGSPFFMYGEVCARSMEVIYRGDNYNCSPCYYTWKESKDYPWDMDPKSWDSVVAIPTHT
ncbi:MAG: alpha-amylase, partial [Muribaculaceae bacterium]|nr:alpha-amylase [Muribaculaceae bacterium]